MFQCNTIFSSIMGMVCVYIAFLVYNVALINTQIVFIHIYMNKSTLYSQILPSHSCKNSKHVEGVTNNTTMEVRHHLSEIVEFLQAWLGKI